MTDDTLREECEAFSAEQGLLDYDDAAGHRIEYGSLMPSLPLPVASRPMA